MVKLAIKLFRSKIITAIALLFLLLVTGVIGFALMSGYRFIDALYMTVITITTVGFGEVRPLDDGSKLFTIFLILTSIIIVGYAITVITEYILSRHTIEDLKQKKMQKKIDNLNNHIIICGYGRNGKQAAQKLMAYKKPFVIVEQDKDVVEKYRSEMVPFVLGNANEDETLLKAGVAHASTLISALPNDADNLFVVLSARQLNKQLKIISRASQETSYNKLKLAGANNVILPDKIGGNHMASLVVVPDLIEFIDNLEIGGSAHVNIEEIDVKLLLTNEVEKSIRELDLRKTTGCNIIGYKDGKGDYVINPEATQALHSDGKIIVLGRSEQIQKLKAVYNIT
ncbi:potassium channel family protein [Bizionia sediminis]|uniref:Potassium channel family protein n=1 Tax=Bizionia sediminis TaxID=1737064 RepID=A0ABW5KVH8_9FLAO